MLVYLAGCITLYDALGTLEEAETWRKIAQEKLEDLGYKVFNPTINYKRNKDIAYKDSRIVVEQNLTYLKKTDIVLVNLEHLNDSLGTLFELYYAYLNNIPVVAFGYNKFIHQPHIKASITFRVDTLEEALDVVSSMFGVVV